MEDGLLTSAIRHLVSECLSACVRQRLDQVAQLLRQMIAQHRPGDITQHFMRFHCCKPTKQILLDRDGRAHCRSG